MASQPTAQQASTPYRLVGPDGFVAVFNDEADPDFTFNLNGEEALTGLDSPEVRAALYDRIEAHGAIAGRFHHGIRPITASGEMIADTIADRNERESRLRQALNNCMAADGTLTWTPSGSIEQFVKVRKHQPARIRGGFRKSVFLALVAADPFIYSTALHVASSINVQVPTPIENQGNDFGPPQLLRVHGPSTSFNITREWDGVQYAIHFNLVLTTTQYADIDPIAATIVRKTEAVPNVQDPDDPSTNVYSSFDFAASTWWLLGPGVNTLTLGAVDASTSTELTIEWRDTWV